MHLNVHTAQCAMGIVYDVRSTCEAPSSIGVWVMNLFEL